jgi:LPS-assembly protein
LVGVVALLLAPSISLAQQGRKALLQGEHHGPVDVTGRTFIYDYKTDTFVVSGDAVITQGKTILTADQVDLKRRQRVVHAVGHVRLVDPLGEITGSEGDVNLSDETADLIDGKVTDGQKTYRLEGAKISKQTGQRYSVTKGFFTTCGCDPGTPAWSITADQMNVHLGDEGIARGARFNILGYPVLYLPYAVFPANTDRHSGLLSPRIGESGMRGFQLVQPYYFDINKSSDATVALDVETSMRVGAIGEYRLVNGTDDYLLVDGSFYDEHLRSAQSRISDVVDTQIADTHIPINRFDIIGMARQHLTDNLTIYGDGLNVSDDLFLREMNVWTMSRGVGNGGPTFADSFNTMRSATSDFGLLDSFENGYAQLDGTWNQDLIQQQQFALQTLPELLASGRKELLGGLLYTDYDVQGVNFYRSTGVGGTRFDLNPRITLPWRLSDYLYGFGTLGVRETVYDTWGPQINIIPVGSQNRKWNNALALGPLGQGGWQTREMFYGTAGIASEFERIYDLDWKSVEKLKHTIEPFVTYSYVPRIDQTQLPLFDETDRMEPRSLITYGFTSRLYGKIPALMSDEAEGDQSVDGQPASAISPLRARTGIGASSVEELVRFTLLQAYDTTNAVAKGASRFSDIQASTILFPTRLASLGADVGFSPSQSALRYSSIYLNFQPWWTNNTPKMYMGKASTGSFLQVSYNYIGPGPTEQAGVNANFSQFVMVKAYYDLFDRMGVFFAPSYDFATGRMLSTEYGLRLKSKCDCWAFDMGVTKTINPNDTQFQFQVTLGGLGSVGETPFGRNPFESRVGFLPTYR